MGERDVMVSSRSRAWFDTINPHIHPCINYNVRWIDKFIQTWGITRVGPTPTDSAVTPLLRATNETHQVYQCWERSKWTCKTMFWRHDSTVYYIYERGCCQQALAFSKEWWDEVPQTDFALRGGSSKTSKTCYFFRIAKWLFIFICLRRWHWLTHTLLSLDRVWYKFS